MKYIKNLQEFIINESVLYLSNKFRDRLESIFIKSSNISDKVSEKGTPEEIAYRLFNSEFSDVKPDTTFVDLSKEGFLSFTQMKNAKKILGYEPDDDKINHLSMQILSDINSSNINNIYSTSRNEIKVGKFIRSIFSDYTDAQIEKFVNTFKSSEIKETEVFEIVKGDDIAFWYKYDNYLELKGTLGNSCMRNRSKYIFDIYTKNPEVCQMLILKDVESNKIKGRALLWNVSKCDEVTLFMDRVYTIDDSDLIKFQEKAKELGYFYKWKNTYDSFEYINYNGDRKYVSMMINLKSDDYNEFPYMDTFRKYDPSTYSLYNDDDSEDGYYLLDQTDGSYTNIEDNNTVYSDYYGENLDEENAVYSEHLNDYLDRNRAVEVTIGSNRHRDWYPRNDDDIVYDAYRQEHIHINDSTYSDYLDDHIFSEDAIEIITEISDNDIDSSGIVSSYRTNDYVDIVDNDYVDIVDVESLLWFKILNDNVLNRAENYNGILKDILVKDINNNWILSSNIVKVFYCDEIDSYLTKIDSQLLNKSISGSVDELDKYDYYEELNTKGILLELKSLIDNEISKNNKILIKNIKTIEFEEEEINSEYDNKIRKNINILSTKQEDISTYLDFIK